MEYQLVPSVIIDGQSLKLYGLGKATFTGGTEGYVKTLARGLAERGYRVHVITPDLEREEQRAEHEFWWGPHAHPTRCDYWVGVHSLEFVTDVVAQHFVLAPNGIDPFVGAPGNGWTSRLSAVACFSQCHVDLLMKARPMLTAEQCRITGLGVDVDDYRQFDGMDVRRWPAAKAKAKMDALKYPSRMLYANDPARGLWHLLPIFDAIHAEMSNAQLRIAYDFDRQFEAHRWQATAMAERMWQCKERIERGDGVVNLGNLTREQLVAEQLSCDLHIMPSDPPNIGSQIHGLSQGEMAAAGVPLLLSDIEAFPEVFGECATVLPLPGSWNAVEADGQPGRVTIEDWANEAIRIMKDRDRWQEMSERGRKWAASHSWECVLDSWEEMLNALPLD